jgi:hypothetical protein
MSLTTAINNLDDQLHFANALLMITEAFKQQIFDGSFADVTVQGNSRVLSQITGWAVSNDYVVEETDEPSFIIVRLP